MLPLVPAGGDARGIDSQVKQTVPRLFDQGSRPPEFLPGGGEQQTDIPTPGARGLVGMPLGFGNRGDLGVRCGDDVQPAEIAQCAHGTVVLPHRFEEG